MTEEEQEKLYELLFKDTKNKLEEIIEKQQKEIEALELIHETYKEVIEDIEDRYISKDKIREKIEELNAMEISQDIYYDDIKEMFEELLEE